MRSIKSFEYRKFEIGPVQYPRDKIHNNPITKRSNTTASLFPGHAKRHFWD